MDESTSGPAEPVQAGPGRSDTSRITASVASFFNHLPWWLPACAFLLGYIASTYSYRGGLQPQLATTEAAQQHWQRTFLHFPILPGQKLRRGQPASNTTAGASAAPSSLIAGKVAEVAGGVVAQKHYLYGDGPGLYECQRELWPSGAWFGSPAGERVSVPATELIGTSVAQKRIHQHQNPDDCSKAKFLVHFPHRGGIGSQLHVMGKMLAIAIKQGRVYLSAFSNGTTFWTNGAFCPPDSSLDGCFLEPFSKCTLVHAGFDATHQELVYNDTSWRHSWRGHEEFPQLKDDRQDPDIQRGVKTVIADGFAHVAPYFQLVPPPFQYLMEVSNIEPRHYFFWWRAQAAAYMMRPTQRTLAELERRRGRAFDGASIPPGTISVHVRHGDKWKEASLIGNDKYDAVAASVLRAGGGSLQRRILLSTDDPETVEYFNKSRAGWEVLHTRWNRSSDRNKSTLDFAREPGNSAPDVFLSSLLDLSLVLECDAWVGDLASNWGRLSEELRATVRCKAGNIYHDVRQSYPPDELGIHE